MWRLVRSVWRLIDSWWRRDRVRASPREGRLLRLTPPRVLIVAGEAAQIARRSVRIDGGHPRVTYHCVTRAGCALLRVNAAEPAHGILWQTKHGTQRLHEEDIEVY